jgi:hypothetical protein
MSPAWPRFRATASFLTLRVSMNWKSLDRLAQPLTSPVAATAPSSGLQLHPSAGSDPRIAARTPAFTASARPALAPNGLGTMLPRTGTPSAVSELLQLPTRATTGRQVNHADELKCTPFRLAWTATPRQRPLDSHPTRPSPLPSAEAPDVKDRDVSDRQMQTYMSKTSTRTSRGYR